MRVSLSLQIQRGGIALAHSKDRFQGGKTHTISIMKWGDLNMMKAMFAVLALVLGLTFGATTFVQADEKKAAPAAEKKEEKKAEKKEEKKK